MNGLKIIFFGWQIKAPSEILPIYYMSRKKILKETCFFLIETVREKEIYAWFLFILTPLYHFQSSNKRIDKVTAFCQFLCSGLGYWHYKLFWWFSNNLIIWSHKGGYLGWPFLYRDLAVEGTCCTSVEGQDYLF